MQKTFLDSTLVKLFNNTFKEKQSDICFRTQPNWDVLTMSSRYWKCVCWGIIWSKTTAQPQWMPLNFTESLMQPCPLNPITGNKLYSSPQQAMHQGHCSLTGRTEPEGKHSQFKNLKKKKILQYPLCLAELLST